MNNKNLKRSLMVVALSAGGILLARALGPSVDRLVGQDQRATPAKSDYILRKAPQVTPAVYRRIDTPTRKPTPRSYWV